MVVYTVVFTPSPQAGVRRRAELLYQQLDGLQALRREVRPEFLAESRKHKAAKLLRQIPCIGRIRAARLIALNENGWPRKSLHLLTVLWKRLTWPLRSLFPEAVE